MAYYDRIEVMNTMQHQGVVPLFFNRDITIAKKILQACYDGGSRLLEFTNRGDFAHQVFDQLNKFALEKLPGMILGVGSVTDAGAASLYMQLGANFVVTPVFREDIAIVCNRRKVLWSPGCGSLTEITKAEEMGCEIVKLFPGSVYGPKFIKAVKAPQPWTKIMPTGGVDITKENLQAWFEAGATCVGMGSKLISKDIIENQKYDLLEERVRNVLQLVVELRS